MAVLKHHGLATGLCESPVEHIVPVAGRKETMGASAGGIRELRSGAKRLWKLRRMGPPTYHN
jgi:hypothetical protein